MPIPINGTVSFSSIMNEASYNPFDQSVKLSELNSGLLFSINTNSAIYPDPSPPYYMGSWRGYDHNGSICYPITVYFTDVSEYDSCFLVSGNPGTSVIGIHIDNFSLDQASNLYQDSSCNILAPPGYYSDGSYYVYWDGSSIVNSDSCFNLDIYPHDVYYDTKYNCFQPLDTPVWTDNSSFQDSRYIFSDPSYTIAQDGFYLDSNGVSLEWSVYRIINIQFC